jgi:hypothetical protein
MKTTQATLKDCLALKCLDCCGGDWEGVLNCTSKDCPLLSTRPTDRRDKLKAKFWSETKGHLKVLPVIRKRETSEEQKAAAERLARDKAPKE